MKWQYSPSPISLDYVVSPPTVLQSLPFSQQHLVQALLIELLLQHLHFLETKLYSKVLISSHLSLGSETEGNMPAGLGEINASGSFCWIFSECLVLKVLVEGYVAETLRFDVVRRCLK